MFIPNDITIFPDFSDSDSVGGADSRDTAYPYEQFPRWNKTGKKEDLACGVVKSFDDNRTLLKQLPEVGSSNAYRICFDSCLRVNGSAEILKTLDFSFSDMGTIIRLSIEV